MFRVRPLGYCYFGDGINDNKPGGLYKLIISAYKGLLGKPKGNKLLTQNDDIKDNFKGIESCRYRIMPASIEFQAGYASDASKECVQFAFKTEYRAKIEQAY